MSRFDRVCAGLVEAGWLGAVLLLPLYMNTSSVGVFEPAKAGLLRALAMLVLVGWVGGARRAGGGWWRAPVAWAALAVVGVTSIATALSLSPRDSVLGLHDRAGGLLTLLAGVTLGAAVAGHLRSRTQLDRLVSAVLLPSVPVAVYAWFQRFGLEPLAIASRETEIQRALSTLGQPVYLGAYLVMVMPFAVWRLHAAWADRTSDRRILEMGVYTGICTLQLGALLFSESRGPLVGLAAAALLACLCVAWRRGWRRVPMVLGGLVALGGVALAIGLPQRLVAGREGQAGARLANRAAATFEARGGGGMFRSVSWTVAARAAANRTPVLLVDGRRDGAAALRPVFGYGPETQPAVSPALYDADMPKVFGYFITDRYHNDLWDALVTTGALGLLAWLLLQAFGFAAVVQALGLSRRGFWAAYGGGGVSGALVAVANQGVPFVFLGVQGGAIAGLCLFVGWSASAAKTSGSSRAQDATSAEAYAPLVGVVALAALVAHVLEASFSFTIVTTGALFWVLIGVVVAAGQTPFAAEPPPASKAAAKKKGQRVSVREIPAAAVAGGAMLALVIAALGAAFVRAARAPSAGTVLWQALTGLHQPPATSFPVVAMLVLVSVAAALVLFAGPPRSGRVVALVGLLAGGAFWIALSTSFARLAAKAPSAAARLPRQFEVREGAATLFYVFVMVALVVLALALAAGSEREASGAHAARVAPWRAGWFAAAVAAGVTLVVTVSLRAAWSDTASAIGGALRAQGQIAQSVEAHERATSLAPAAAAHHAALAKAYTKRAESDAPRVDAWLGKAEASIDAAIALAPGNPENATNRAVVYAAWAARAPADARAALRGKAAAAIDRAVEVNPHDPDLRRRRALLRLGLLRDPGGALADARHALLIEPNGPAARNVFAECLAAVARGLDGAARKQTLLEAAAAFTHASALDPKRTAPHLAAARAYLDAGTPLEAVKLLRDALAVVPPGEQPRVQALLDEAQKAAAASAG